MLLPCSRMQYREAARWACFAPLTRCFVRMPVPALAWALQEFRRNAFNTDSVDEALDLLDFCYKIVARSGLSENGTYLPKAIHPKVRATVPARRQHSSCSGGQPLVKTRAGTSSACRTLSTAAAAMAHKP